MSVSSHDATRAPLCRSIVTKPSRSNRIRASRIGPRDTPICNANSSSAIRRPGSKSCEIIASRKSSVTTSESTRREARPSPRGLSAILLLPLNCCL